MRLILGGRINDDNTNDVKYLLIDIVDLVPELQIKHNEVYLASISNEKESNFHSKIKLSLNGLKRIAIENITQVNVDLLNEKLISLLSEEEQENR